MSTRDPSLIWSSGSRLAEMNAAGRGPQGLGSVVVLMPWLKHRAAQQAAKTMLARAGAAATILALQDALGVARSGALDGTSRNAMQGLEAGPVITRIFAALATHCLALGQLPGRALDELRNAALRMAGSG